MEKGPWESMVVEITLGLKWYYWFVLGWGMGVYLASIIVTYWMWLEKIRWHGMLFATLFWASHFSVWIKMSSNCSQRRICPFFFHWSFLISVPLGQDGRLVSWWWADSILCSPLFCMRNLVAKTLKRAWVTPLCRLCPSFNWCQCIDLSALWSLLELLLYFYILSFGSAVEETQPKSHSQSPARPSPVSHSSLMAR